MLVHICCSVDSHYFFLKLQDEYPDEKFVGFFYDPNIHPYSEYYLRYLDVQRSCKKLGLELIEGDYNYDEWLKAVRGLEDEPEKGDRCLVCFDNRFEETAKKAHELGESSFTSTLLMSPKKSLPQLKAAASPFEEKYDIEFKSMDLRKGGGTNEQFALSRKEKMYHQDYCGCIFALNKQRDGQKKYTSELICDISGKTDLGSIEERIELFEYRNTLEEENIDYEIVQEEFLNYRLLMGSVKSMGKVWDSYILPYSVSKRAFIQTKIEFESNGIYFSRHQNIRFLNLEKFNELTNKNYKSVKELMYKPMSIEDDIKLRQKIVGEYNLNPIIILDEISKDAKYKIHINSVTWMDNKPVIIKK